MPESLEVLRGRGAAQLAMAILQKAADDYRDLCNRGKDSRITRDEWGYSKKEIKGIPSAEKHGEWRHLKGDEWLCSNCGYVVWTEGSWEHPLERGKDYCEHCGAHMKGADMSENSCEYEPWVEKCLTCKHAYQIQADADELRCRCRKGCNYEPYKRQERSRHE